ncbi:helix-turn-helix domain-containing protein [Imhoffiella purpurea]|uniref:helix-turn-helix domain-containing protein n=1 Tax=Imhoffiella purpurea TaxID=1249627 RepID=UPI0012FE028B
MSLSALEWAWGLAVSPTQKLVALALADHANEDRECWPSLSRLSTRTGLSPTALKDALNGLEQAQIVIRIRERGRATTYRLGFNGRTPRPGGGLGRDAAKPGDGSTRPGDDLGRETARPSGDSTRPSGGPELGRLAATNRKLNRKEPLAASSSSHARGIDDPKWKGEQPARLSLNDLPDSWRAWAAKARSDLDLEAVWIGFRDHWQAATGEKAVSADWFEVWRKWVKRERGIVDERETPSAGGNAREHCPDFTKGATPREDIPWMH